ncbi:TPA: hypothetical protein ACWLXL_004392 [Pseudomonas aeruginosa]
MKKDVIRKSADGFELNFGPLVIVEVAGFRAATQDWRAKQLGLAIVEQAEEEEIPEFLDDLPLIMKYAIAEITVYPFEKADIKVLGKALSELDGLGDVPNRVVVEHHARVLMTWENGAQVGEQYTLDHFYDGLSAEEIERSRF